MSDEKSTEMDAARVLCHRCKGAYWSKVDSRGQRTADALACPARCDRGYEPTTMTDTKAGTTVSAENDAAFLERFAAVLLDGTYCPDPSPYHAEVVARGAAAIRDAERLRAEVALLQSHIDILDDEDGHLEKVLDATMTRAEKAEAEVASWKGIAERMNAEGNASYTQGVADAPSMEQECIALLRADLAKREAERDAAIARADRLAGFIHRHVVDNKTYEMSGDSYGQLRHAALAALAADSKDGAK
jgi:hypothetical protein